MFPFAPVLGSTVSLAATNASGNVALSKQPTDQFQLRLYNSGASLAFLNFGNDNTAAATTANYPLPAGAIEVITIQNKPNAPINYMAAITASGTATVYATVGVGE